ncbi:MAG: glycosyltransferase [Limisphaerales bacterium]
MRGIIRSYHYVNTTCVALEDYEAPKSIVANRVFFAASAWPEPEHRELVERRAQVLRAAKRLAGRDFEGGFRPLAFAQANYPDLVYRHLSHFEFVYLLASSDIIIHTLGCHDCFAWRFGEALAVSRPLLSESLANELPEPPRHEEHVLFFERGDIHSFEQALLRLQSENGLRQHLAAGARRYYERWIRPSAMMQRLLERTSRLF